MSKLKELLKDEMPREKLINQGVEQLTNVELLAIILRTGTKEKNVLELSREILQRYPLHFVSRKLYHELLKFRGISKAKATQIIATFELSRRLSQKRTLKNTKLSCSKEVYQYIGAELEHLHKERVVILLVNTKNTLIRKEILHEGSLSSSIIEPREIVKKVLDFNASGFFLIHNHPSGDSTPSKEDIEITKRIQKISTLLEVKFLDHIIIGSDYFSFFDKEIL